MAQRPINDASVQRRYSFEKCFYVGTWTCAAMYSLYALYNVSYEYRSHPYLRGYHLGPGWKIFQRMKDQTDHEWLFWKAAMSQGLWAWLIGHVFLGQVLRWHFWQRRNIIFLVSSLLFTIWLVGITVTVVFLLEVIIILTVAWFSSSPCLVWITAMGFLSMKSVQFIRQYTEFEFWHKSESPSYMFQEFFLSMGLIRYISYALYICELRKQRKEVSTQHGSETKSTKQLISGSSQFYEGRQVWLLVDGLCYIFYVPLSLAGPIITFNNFILQFHRSVQPRSSAQLWTITKGLLRFLGWGFVFECLTHVLYCSAFINEPDLLTKVNLPALASIAYICGQLFQMKYIVIWALFSACARLDQLEPPGLPSCVARIVLYSDMWKQFDRGLYNFIKTHIYIPLGGSRYGMMRQVFGTFASFAFVYIWHGATWSIFYWILLNFTTIVLEGVGKSISNIPHIKRFKTEKLSAAGCRRIRGLFITPLLLASSFGIFTFFGGTESGYIIFHRLIIDGFPTSSVVLFFLVYCVVQTSLEYDNWVSPRQAVIAEKED